MSLLSYVSGSEAFSTRSSLDLLATDHSYPNTKFGVRRKISEGEPGMSNTSTDSMEVFPRILWWSLIGFGNAQEHPIWGPMACALFLPTSRQFQKFLNYHAIVNPLRCRRNMLESSHMWRLSTATNQLNIPSQNQFCSIRIL